MEKKTLWSDEDGVIAVYEPHAYRPDKNQTPLWMQPDIHYYENLTPDMRIISVYQNLQTRYRLPVIVLTNITDMEPLSTEHANDKYKWTKKHLPYLNMDNQFFPIQIPKCQFAIWKLQRPLMKTDILISDYNHDLVPWENAGGTGVKYLNGINSEDSFPGAKIYPEWSTDQIQDYILSL